MSSSVMEPLSTPPSSDRKSCASWESSSPSSTGLPLLSVLTMNSVSLVVPSALDRLTLPVMLDCS